ncbi:MAG: NADH oxidase [Firmicutes bacterium ADurb.Bin182]|nr:MAG: NADH oxidase [Firmicutes bacterium ADurb.Bin182]
MSKMLEPVKIGQITLHNRLVMPPMATSKAEEDGSVTRAILDYYDEKSKGGCIGLIITEHCFISVSGKAGAGQMSAADDSIIKGMSMLCETIHMNDSKTAVQLNHAGSAALRDITGMAPVAPSQVSNPRKENELPHELTEDEINGIVRSFANAAERVQKAGFDGVEIHSAHGYLLNQFFSPLTNKRTDGYGGNVLNRIRIHLEVIDAVKKRCGADFPVLLRLGACDYTEGGTRVEDSLIAAREFEKAGVDALDISGGFNGYIIPGESCQGWFAPVTEAIKKVVSIPVILTGGITEAEAAERLVREKKADLIGVGRAILADSNWAKTAIEILKQKT